MAGVKGRSGGARPNVAKARVPGSARWKREQIRLKRGVTGVVKPTAPAKPPVVTLAKPEGFPAGQSAVWDALAPHALQARTLTPATEWAFRDLCDLIVLRRAALSRISQEGLVVGDVAHPLLSRHAALQVRVEAMMTRFRLAPMGKEFEVAEEKADEFAEFDQPLSVIRGGRA